ncbi:MAG TPA: radical SAM protein [Myxococcota bacterium]
MTETTMTTTATTATTTTTKQRPLRRLNVVESDHFPAYVVWELTLRCDHACAHCGSRAGGARDDELTTDKALAVVAELTAMRAREVVLIGGEAYLHPGFLDVVAALKAAGIRPSMTTGGKGVTAALAAQMKAAGMHSVSVSVDGLEVEHNLMRQSSKSYVGALHAIDVMRAAGLLVAANTNINRLNQHTLEDLFDVLVGHGISAWQVQITVPLGRAADRPQLLLQPWDLLDVVPRIARLVERGHDKGVVVMPGNNLGYFGPEEALLRSPHDVRKAGAPRDHWQGCQAGKRVMGIESDGGVKGCPSLQAHYVGGSLRDRSLSSLWNDTAPLAFNRDRGVDDLYGYCRTCPFAEVCKGGCTFTAHALFGRPGDNPYCHFRARDFAARGLRERLVPLSAAEGLPFDNGLFAIVVEDKDAPEPLEARLTDDDRGLTSAAAAAASSSSSSSAAALSPRELVAITRPARNKQPSSTAAPAPAPAKHDRALEPA